MRRQPRAARTRRSGSALAYGSRSTTTAETTSSGSYITSGDATRAGFLGVTAVVGLGAGADQAQASRARARGAQRRQREFERAVSPQAGRGLPRPDEGSTPARRLAAREKGLKAGGRLADGPVGVGVE
jgi:hypothetical protein